MQVTVEVNLYRYLHLLPRRGEALLSRAWCSLYSGGVSQPYTRVSLMSQRGVESDDGQWVLVQTAAAECNRYANDGAYFLF